MSTGPIPLLTAADLSFTPGTPDFTDFVAQQLGNLGTDSDGFDLLLSDTIALADEAGTLLDSFDPNLLDAVASAAALSAGDPATDQASLVSAGNAVDAALNDFVGTLPAPQNTGTGGGTGPGTSPAPCQPGSVVKGQTIGLPDPNPYPALPSNIPHVFQWHNLNSVCINSAVQDITVANGRLTPADVAAGTPDTGYLAYGDQQIFAETDNQNFQASGFENWDVHLTITPKKTGQFQAIVARPAPPGPAGPAGTGGGIGYLFIGYRITIVSP